MLFPVPSELRRSGVVGVGVGDISYDRGESQGLHRERNTVAPHPGLDESYRLTDTHRHGWPNHTAVSAASIGHHQADVDRCTTFMIRQCPSSLTLNGLLNALEEHHLLHLCDFVFLPHRAGCPSHCRGFGFINFKSVAAAQSSSVVLPNILQDRGGKTLAVAPAHVQGFTANMNLYLRKFSGSSPAVFIV